MLCSVNFQINHDPTENESALICSIVSKLFFVSNLRIQFYGIILSHLLHTTVVFPYVLHIEQL